MSPYGNISWKFYVYGAYGIVAFALFAYIFYALQVRRSCLKNLSDEGFFHEDK
jgi:hypothetical protein